MEVELKHTDGPRRKRRSSIFRKDDPETALASENTLPPNPITPSTAKDGPSTETERREDEKPNRERPDMDKSLLFLQTYPEEYRTKLEGEIDQWQQKLSQVKAEYIGLKEQLDSSTGQVRMASVDLLVATDREFLDHAFYYEYLHAVRTLCDNVACSVQTEREKLEEIERSKKLLDGLRQGIVDFVNCKQDCDLSI